MGAVSVVITVLLLLESGTGVVLDSAMASPLAFGRFLFERYWFSVEIASYLLFVALVGALYLGRTERTGG
jgi:NADH:ubiquinone oxidoreductase subunit 6 (subunit J)